MKYGKNDATKVDTSGKSLWTRFVQTLNSWLNPNHAWSDYSTWKDAGSGYLDNLVKGWTQSGVTAQQSGLNEMQMQNAEDIYQRQVSGMQKAGLNPALMYQSGVSSAPSAPSGTNMAGASMSDLMQLLLLPVNRRLLEAQTDNVKAAADQKRAETETEGIRQETMRAALAYYPEMQEATLDEIFSRIGLNWSSANERDASAALAWSKKFLQDKENQYSDEFFHWRNELEKAQTTEAIQAAADHMAQAAWLGYQKTFAQTHGVLLSGSPLIAIASMMSHSLSSILGIRENGSDGSKPSVEQIVSGAVGKLKEGNKEKPRVKRQEEIDFHERWSKMSRWQRFRYRMEHMD